ncbi:MAG: hypothetical protein PHD11_03840 [Bacteroidales bacterium]|nr:hypothetical protein [Bacteroidales bacterium]MDD4670345.1 hypothetical protein [Bacteroidales bacterium]
MHVLVGGQQVLRTYHHAHTYWLAVAISGTPSLHVVAIYHEKATKSQPLIYAICPIRTPEPSSQKPS